MRIARLLLVLIGLCMAVYAPGPTHASPASSSEVSARFLGSIGYGETVSDRVTSRSGDRWTFSGSTGDRVTIAMNSSSIDTYLELYGPNGDLLTRDDDGGSGYNSLIRDYRLPSSGTYTIVAKGYGGATGSYTLSLARN